MTTSLANLQNSELLKQRQTVHNYNHKTNNASKRSDTYNIIIKGGEEDS
jgi:hypothetical protein